MKNNKLKKAIYTGETNLYFTNGEEYVYKNNDIDDSNNPFYHEYLFLDEEYKEEFSHHIDKEFFKDNFLKVKKEKVKKVGEAVSVKSDPEFFTKGCIYKFEKQPNGFYYIEDNISNGVIDHMFTKDQFKINFVVIKKGKKQHD